MRIKVTPAIILFIVPYAFVVAAYVIVRRFAEGVSFSEHRDALGAAMAFFTQGLR